MLALPERLTRDGIALRPSRKRDQPFLRALFATLRMDAAALAQWPEAQREPFLDDQFRLQDLHFRRFYPKADFLVIAQHGTPIGRLILDRGPSEWSLIDIGFLPPFRGRGLGEGLLRWFQASLKDAGARTFVLQVEFGNPARRLYERLGFVEDGNLEPGGLHAAMVWKAGP